MSFAFASAFVHGFILLQDETLIAGSGEFSQSKRYTATLPVLDFECLPGSPEHELLTSTISCDHLPASVSAFFPSNTHIPVVGEILYVAAKFVALAHNPLVMDTTFHQLVNLRTDSDSNNPPDPPMPCTVHACGRVDEVYTEFPQYGEYRGFDLRTAAWVKENAQTVDFKIRILIPQNKRFLRTLLPRKNSILNVHDIVFGRDKGTGYLVLLLKEFSFLPRPSTTVAASGESASSPQTPRKKGWGRPPPPTLSPKSRTASSSFKPTTLNDGTEKYSPDSLPGPVENDVDEPENVDELPAPKKVRKSYTGRKRSK